jgi:hypothetical protein
LASHANALKGLAGAMEALEFPVLEIGNNDQRRRGIEYTENFVSAVRAAIREARENRGDFAGQKAAIAPPKKSKK